MDDSSFKPGFRFSIVDGIILLAAVILLIYFQTIDPIYGVIIGLPIGHFFLFCNVFRISRRPEIIWAIIFVILISSSGFLMGRNTILVIVIMFILTLFILIREMRKPSYHGIFWRQINPDLAAWWTQNAKSRPSG